jgi:chromosome segregation protein
MRLKKLELNGFKSFPEKAAIHFPQGVCAVVGPNGCGKSNIFDALRWVMGEQSVKQLRGKNMEDVIFAGASNKPAQNFAEVSLTMLNDNGSAPEELKDFTEIMLTRRLYRSGESAYFMNKRPCRLKDIQNVFLGSGLGSKSYAIIQQGNIGAITEAGPEERRYYIEEAAGTTRYKQRKIETLRKINSTNQNLLRVNDIVAELKRQMASLKRQARKAELYRSYQQRIRKLDICLTVSAYDELQEEMAQTARLLQDLKDTDFEQNTKLRKLDAAVEEIKLRRADKNQQIGQQKATRFEAQRSADRWENELAHLRTETERLGQEARDLEAARSELSAKLESMGSEISEVEERNRNLQQDREKIRARLDAERESEATVKAELARVNEGLETRKAGLMELAAQEARYKNIYQNASDNRENLKRRLKRTDEEQALAHRKVAETQNARVKAEKRLQQLDAALAELDGRIAEGRRQLEEKNRALAGQVKLVQTLAFDRNQAQSEHSALKKMEAGYEWYKDGVKAVMNWAAEDQGAEASRGILGLTADIFEPEPSYEIAVEAALGESLQYILVEDTGAGVGAIEYLQGNEAGRGGFVPVSALRPAAKPTKTRPEADRLLAHVTVKPGCEKLAEILLGHVNLTADLQEALALFNRNGVYQTVVTRQGDLITPQGVMIGGSPDKLTGILAKKQAIKDLEQRMQTLGEKHAAAAKVQNALEAEVRDLEKNLQQQLERREESAYDKLEAEKELYRADEELKQARRHLEVVILEQEQLMGEESDLDTELTEYQQALERIEAEIHAAQDAVAAAKGKVESVSADLENFNRRITDLKVELTALDAKMENNSHTLKRLNEFRQDTQERVQDLAREINQKHQRQRAAQEKIAGGDRQLAEIYASLEALEHGLQENENDYQAMDEQLRTSDTAISALQDERAKTQEKVRLLELQQSERRLKCENLAGRLEERYEAAPDSVREEAGQAQQDFDFSAEQMAEELNRCRNKLARIQDVNLGAIHEYEQLKERYDFLCTQRDDLVQAIEDLHRVIRKINRITQKRFMETFNQVNAKLQEVFPRLFEGGTAELSLTDPANPLETGVEYLIHPPGKKLTRMSLLSGGEKAMAAIAFVFAIFLIRPTSFCLMDEIDAPLDEANIYRFNELLKIIGGQSQIVMITHNKRTMEFADMLFGVTMENKGISKVVSVNLNKSA